jgi:hypothetical protein
MQVIATHIVQLEHMLGSLPVDQPPGNQSVSQLLHNPALNPSTWRYQKLQKRQLGSDPF